MKIKTRKSLTCSLLGIALLVGSVFTAQAQLPPPAIYYDFETEDGENIKNEGEGDNGLYSGGDPEYGDGAPDGSTPGRGLLFPDDNSGCIETSVIVADLLDAMDGYTMSAWINPTEVSGQRILIGQEAQGIHNGIRNQEVLHQAHWGNDDDATTPLEIGEWAHAVWTYDRTEGLGQIFLNGEMDGESGKNEPNQVDNAFIIGNRDGCGGGDGFIGILDDLAIWPDILTEEQIALLAEGASPINLDAEDVDNDGMNDAYEERNELVVGEDDSGLDKDEDGLTNKEEHDGTRDGDGNRVRPQTLANKADSDDDGLSDKVETNTGTFVSADDTGTNPRNDDTDRDDLKDGVETNTGVGPPLDPSKFVDATNTGTSPLNEDSDGDKRKDGREVAAGTNPLDASDPPPSDPNDIVVGYWPLDADLLDASGSGGDGTLMDGEDDVPDFVEGKLGSAISLDGVSEFVEINPDLEDLYSGYDVDAGEPDPRGFSVNAWFKVGLWDKNWQCLVAKGEGNRWRVHRRGGETTITGNGGNADVANNALVEPEDDEWHHLVLISNPDPDVDQVLLYVDGQVEGEGFSPNVEDNANPMMIGENPDARNRTWNGLIDDVAFFNRALTEAEVFELWNDGEGATVGEVFLGAATPLGFRVTNVDYVNGADGAADQVVVTWASRDGATYAVDSSQTIPDEADGWEEAADGVDSDGEETSFTVAVPADASSLYVRVREE